MGGPVGEGYEPGVQHARRWGVGRLRSTVEGLEQKRETAGEGPEGRQSAKENIGQATAPRTQSRIGESSGLLGVRKQHGKTSGRGSPRCSTM